MEWRVSCPGEHDEPLGRVMGRSQILGCNRRILSTQGKPLRMGVDWQPMTKLKALLGIKPVATVVIGW